MVKKLLLCETRLSQNSNLEPNQDKGFETQWKYFWKKMERKIIPRRSKVVVCSRMPSMKSKSWLSMSRFDSTRNRSESFALSALRWRCLRLLRRLRSLEAMDEYNNNVCRLYWECWLMMSCGKCCFIARKKGKKLGNYTCNPFLPCWSSFVNKIIIFLP